VFKELLPHFRHQWLTRKSRPLPDSVQFALKNFENIWIADGSTLEALFKKLQSLLRCANWSISRKNGSNYRPSNSSSRRNLVGTNPK
jgi:hypothetical protein